PWRTSDEAPLEVPTAMSVVDETAARAVAARAARKRTPRRRAFRDTWWRHAVGIVAAVFALFPVVYIVSAAFNQNDSLSSASVFPQRFTLHNFGQILHNPDAPYAHWL